MRAVRDGAPLPGFAWSPWWTNAVLMGVQTGADFGLPFAEALQLTPRCNLVKSRSLLLSQGCVCVLCASPIYLWSS